MLRRVVLMTIGCALTLSACSKKTPETLTPVTPSSPVAERDTAAERMSREAAERARQDSIARARAGEDAAERERQLDAIRDVLEAPVYFEYDDDRLTEEAATALAQKVQILRANPGVSVRITGHTDERGSVEYNLALGMRRAQSVRDYISGFSVDPARLEIVSMGEDQPENPGHDEAAWSRNRRAAFMITSGTTLNAPGR